MEKLKYMYCEILINNKVFKNISNKMSFISY